MHFVGVNTDPANCPTQGEKQVVGSGEFIDIQTGGQIRANGAQAGPITALTDSTGGTASSTLAAITAGAAYSQADMTAVKNALASLAANLNAVLAALKGIGASS